MPHQYAAVKPPFATRRMIAGRRGRAAGTARTSPRQAANCLRSRPGEAIRLSRTHPPAASSGPGETAQHRQPSTILPNGMGCESRIGLRRKPGDPRGALPNPPAQAIEPCSEHSGSAEDTGRFVPWFPIVQFMRAACTSRVCSAPRTRTQVAQRRRPWDSSRTGAPAAEAGSRTQRKTRCFYWKIEGAGVDQTAAILQAGRRTSDAGFCEIHARALAVIVAVLANRNSLVGLVVLLVQVVKTEEEIPKEAIMLGLVPPHPKT